MREDSMIEAAGGTTVVRINWGQLCQDLSQCTAHSIGKISLCTVQWWLINGSCQRNILIFHFLGLEEEIIVAGAYRPFFRLWAEQRLPGSSWPSQLLVAAPANFYFWFVLLWCSVRSEGQSADEGHLWAISNQQAQPSAKATTVQRQLLPRFYSSLAFTTTTHANWSDQSPYTRTAVLGLRMCQRYAHTDAPCTSQGHFDGGLVALVSALAPPGGSDSHYQVHRPPADRK